MNAQMFRRMFLDYFRAHNHAILGSASLIPNQDPSVLFTTAGMHPLVPFLLGEPHPAGKRLANCQKCLRTNDIGDLL
jgi:alanyl-tRNA synthetase